MEILTFVKCPWYACFNTTGYTSQEDKYVVEESVHKACNCCFHLHRDCPDKYAEKLRNQLYHKYIEPVILFTNDIVKGEGIPECFAAEVKVQP